MGRKNKDAVLTENQNWGKIYSDEEDEKMIANYHTHTWRCHHASGTEREYVEAAIRGGLKILGFSDHTPQIYPDGYVNHTKMLPDQLEDYVNVILALKKEYEKDIEIHLGLEVEYYPAYFDKLLALTAQYPIEYYILGQHNLGNEIGDVMVFAPFSSDETLQRYWTSASTAFAPLKTVNNGIGGSTIQDWMTLYEKLIVNYKPSAVVVYVGSNDIAGGKSGKATAAQACLLLKRLKTKLPGVPIYYISIAPSIRRWNLWKENHICNKAVSSFCSKTSGVSFIHCTPYLLKNGKPRKELYRSDQLHFNQKGYQVWNQVIPARIKKDLK